MVRPTLVDFLQATEGELTREQYLEFICGIDAIRYQFGPQYPV